MMAQQQTTPKYKPKRRKQKMTTEITTKMYLDFIRKAIKSHGITVADTANKLALETEAITLDQYRLAARVLVDAYLAQ